MKTKRWISVFTMALASVIVAAVFYKQARSTAESKTNTQLEQGQIHQGDVIKNKADDEPEHEDEHELERIIQISKKEMTEFGVEVAEAGPVKIQTYINLPGQVALNADRLAHVVPRVSGIARQVRKVLGDHVRKGEVMAILESRELADAKAAFLAARERISLARANFVREEGLWKGKISAEQDFLEAKQAFAEARINLRSAEQKLHALGFSEASVKKLLKQPDASFTRYEIVSPFDGVVIEKHIVLGEVLRDDARVYIVADMNSVWVDISVYQKDLPVIRKGLPVILSAGRGISDTTGTITYVGPLVGQKTRTALARVVLPNPNGQWRPGLFVTAKIAVDTIEVPVGVPKEALQKMEDKPHVFVKKPNGFSPEPVTLGRSNDRYVEITSGLLSGQKYVSKGAFTLKAQLSKESFGDGHGH
ncbi:MAG: efflux RND transporter periplasmic adaptor subunit [Deltaproteobacteria bacterium]|nr:efflux RND transporter periplasmic adaptor subunit [Deltaproteobacteria bacterium]